VKSYSHPRLATGARLPRDFEYLVGMPISTLTAEKVAKLMQEQEKKAGTKKVVAEGLSAMQEH
jgi:hypothetical protein